MDNITDSKNGFVVEVIGNIFTCENSCAKCWDSPMPNK